MPTKKHYFIEQNQAGRFAVRAKESERASTVVDSQKEAIERAKEFNPEDKPDVERVRTSSQGRRDQWRSGSGRSKRATNNKG